MHRHLSMVRDFHEKFGINQPEEGEIGDLAIEDIVNRQALILACASETFKAIATEDLVRVMAGLVDLSFNSLAAIACRGDDIVPVSVNWRQDGSVLSVVRVLSEKINQCTSGETIHYSALYAICVHLTRGFVNADFDEAFDIVYQDIIRGGGGYPDLSSAFFD